MQTLVFAAALCAAAYGDDFTAVPDLHTLVTFCNLMDYTI